MRLIDADAVINELEEMANNEWNISVGSSKGLNDAIDVIDNAPTVEGEILTEEAYSDLCLRASRERPQGKWIRTGSLGNGNAHYECSECHYGDEHAENQEVPYCWHCGADMRGEKK